jgi:hypothetical protein
MTTLVDTPEFTADEVYQIEGTDPVQGAASGAQFGGLGIDNQPHQQLANRTAFLMVNKANLAGSTSQPFSVSNLTAATGVFSNVEVTDTASGNFTVPTGVTKLKVRLWGDGAGSGACVGAPSAGGPGSAGGYAEGVLTVTPGQVIPFTVGQGGTPGVVVAGPAPSSGGNGSGSTFGPLSATGGTGGLGGNGGIVTSVQNGGVGSGGYLNVTGGTGNGNFPLAGGVVAVGSGGGSFGTPPAHGGSNGVSSNGITGTFPGGGATGSCNEADGAPGAPGLIIVEW